MSRKEKITLHHVLPGRDIDNLMPYIIIDAETRDPHTVRATSFADAIERYGKPVHDSGRIAKMLTEDVIAYAHPFVFGFFLQEMVEMADALGWDRDRTLWSACKIDDITCPGSTTFFTEGIDLVVWPEQSLPNHFENDEQATDE